ncbi:chitinase-like protein 1 [Primulina huaijiensis]|uniref:chitinase-like protein 1 n=1 Tax=Primulina huaijiensis TaxID=1492673 RepID=UPI003CC6F9B3
MMMGNRRIMVALLIPAMVVYCACMVSGDDEIKEKKVGGKRMCDQGWECKGFSAYCCNQTISKFFQTYQFENIFSKRNSPVAHAVGFWDYRSFILSAAVYQPLGFGTTGGKLMQMKELAAFLGHVGAKTSCGYGVATGGPLSWGLCYNKEMSPSQDYCDDFFKYEYPCSPGAQYYGRGAIPVYWNHNYGKIGNDIKIDLLNHPEYLEQNATIAFMSAMSMWMTPKKKGQPSAHDAFVGNWKPTKNDTMEKRVPGFGTTMNILYGDLICGQGEIDPMNVLISHYLYYLDLMGVGREEAGPHEVLSCGEQIAFNPSYKSSS